MIVITTLLGTDSVSGNRLTINSNFAALKSAFESQETGLGINSSTGVIDVTAGTVGEIKSKKLTTSLLLMPYTGTQTISIDGATGIYLGTSMTLSSTIQAVTATLTGTATVQNLVATADVTVTNVLSLLGGVTRHLIDTTSGAVNLTHPVANTDDVVYLGFTAASKVLTLSAGVGLLPKHQITFVNKGTNDFTIDITNILGVGTSLTLKANMVSSITLMYNGSTGTYANKWTILSSNNCTIV